MRLILMMERYAICRLEPDAPIPPLPTHASLLSITLTPHELSIVCPEDATPPGARVDEGWRALQVAGPLDLNLTGVLAELSQPLAQAKIALFAVSTFDTDYLLVREASLASAVDALRAAGHEAIVG